MSRKKLLCIFAVFFILGLSFTGMLYAQEAFKGASEEIADNPLVPLIKDIIKSGICKEQVVNIRGVRAAMKLTGDENDPEGLNVIKEQQAIAVDAALTALSEFGKLNDQNREQAVRLVVKLLDEECAAQ